MDNRMFIQLMQLMQNMDMSQDARTAYSAGEEQSLFEVMQILVPLLPPESQKIFFTLQEAMELRQLILSHARQGGENWLYEMLIAIRPKLPEKKQHMADVLIKYTELAALLKQGVH